MCPYHVPISSCVILCHPLPCAHKCLTGAFATKMADAAEYLCHLRDQLHERSYDFREVYMYSTLKDKIIEHRRKLTHETGTKIRFLKEWDGYYPLFREIMQNICDYLKLTTDDGMLRPEVSWKFIEAPPSDGYDPCERTTGGKICFYVMESEDEVCLLTIYLTDMCTVVFEQSFTFPLVLDMLASGVEDLKKQNPDGNSRGGYGIGFKDAGRSIKYMGGKLTYDMTGNDHERVVWEFNSKPAKKSAVRDILNADDMIVNISATTTAHGKPQNTMKTTVSLPRARHEFFRIMNQIPLFWNRSEWEGVAIGPTLEAATRINPSKPIVGDWLADARLMHIDDRIGKHPTTSKFFPKLTAKPGIYVRGLFVCGPPMSMPHAIVHAGPGSMNVTSSFRNSVHQTEKMLVIGTILLHPNRPRQMKELLEHMIRDDAPDSFLKIHSGMWSEICHAQPYDYETCKKRFWEIMGYDGTVLAIVEPKFPIGKWAFNTFNEIKAPDVQCIIVPASKRQNYMFSMLDESEMKEHAILALREASCEYDPTSHWNPQWWQTLKTATFGENAQQRTCLPYDLVHCILAKMEDICAEQPIGNDEDCDDIMVVNTKSVHVFYHKNVPTMNVGFKCSQINLVCDRMFSITKQDLRKLLLNIYSQETNMGPFVGICMEAIGTAFRDKKESDYLFQDNTDAWWDDCMKLWKSASRIERDDESDFDEEGSAEEGGSDDEESDNGSVVGATLRDEVVSPSTVPAVPVAAVPVAAASLGAVPVAAESTLKRPLSEEDASTMSPSLAHIVNNVPYDEIREICRIVRQRRLAE